jgi:hypothetical protein
VASENYADKYKCISRIDNKSNATFGWEVRIRRRNKQINRFFSDSKYENDAHKSLLAAMESRDLLIEKVPVLDRIERAELKRANNSSGIPGVSRTMNSKSYKEQTYNYAFWQAYWSPKTGVTKSVRFSVKKYGEKQAKKLAIEARKNAINEIKEQSENLLP